MQRKLKLKLLIQNHMRLRKKKSNLRKIKGYSDNIHTMHQKTIKPSISE